MADLRQYEVWSRTLVHRRRVDVARREIERAATLGSLVVSTSWGKDSCALLDLAIDVLGHVDAVHLDSAYKLPGGERVVEHFASRCTVHTVPSVMTLDEIVAWLQTHGLDLDRARLKDAGKRRKTDALTAWVRVRYEVQALGMRAAESKARRECFRARGLTYRAHDLLVSNPIGWWQTEDVWSRIASRGLPYHPLYDCETHGLDRQSLRNAGWLTVQSDQIDARVAWLRAHYPEQYRALADAFPRVGLLS